MRTPLSKVVRILRPTSHVTRWERSTAYDQLNLPAIYYLGELLAWIVEDLARLSADRASVVGRYRLGHDDFARPF
jgi:hypothetical protein